MIVRKTRHLRSVELFHHVEYLDEVHANHARIKSKTLSKILEDMPPFNLRTYDPTNLYCAVSPPKVNCVTISLTGIAEIGNDF